MNSETQAGKERMVSHFLGFVDLRVDRERMDHYIFGKSQADRNGAGESAIDVLAMSLSACGASCSSASSSAAARGHAELAASDACSQMSSTVVVDISREEELCLAGGHTSWISIGQRAGELVTLWASRGEMASFNGPLEHPSVAPLSLVYRLDPPERPGLL